jgi:uncharacterized protein YqgC (DUF456 family)
MWSVLWAVVLLAVLVCCWLLTVIGMPGNWLMVICAGLYAWLAPVEAPATLGWLALGLLVGLAVLGEIGELVASAVGVAKKGGSRRAAVLALVGSMVGGVLGVIAGAPIPVLGSLVGALLFAGLGAMGGAVIGELWAGRSQQQALSVGQAAFWGRLLGTLSKVLMGGVMIAVTIAALVQ